jgi:ATP-dependent DNA helicase RecQ
LANIITVSNQLIALNHDRMKTDHPIQIDAARRSSPSGKPVQIVSCHTSLHQARYVLNTIRELRASKGSIAVFARTKKELHSIRAALEDSAIPSIMAAENKGNIPLHRMREPLALISLIKQLQQVMITATRLQKEFKALACYEKNNPWCQVVEGVLDEWEEETNNKDRAPSEAVDFICEALHEHQRERTLDGGVYLSTVHSAKGLEFDHVIMLGSWERASSPMAREEERRVYYVGMTRARKTLTLCELENDSNPHAGMLNGRGVMRSQAGFFLDPPNHLLCLNYAMADLSSTWIGYPAFSGAIRRRIARLHPGSLICLEQREDESRVFMRDTDGGKVGALSSAASAEWKDKLQSIKEVRVHSIINWRKELLDQEPEKNCPDEWEILLLEIVSFNESPKR